MAEHATEQSESPAMPKKAEWSGSITLHFPAQTFCVEGDTYGEASSEMQKLADKLAEKVGHGAQGSANIQRQISGPWVKAAFGAPWYDLHGPGNIICLEAAFGNRFSERDIALLHERLEKECGLSVVEHWNGAGCGQVSFRCKGREPKDAPMPPEHVEALLAPRPYKEASDDDAA